MGNQDPVTRYCLEVFLVRRPSYTVYVGDRDLDEAVLDQIQSFPRVRRIVVFDLSTGDALYSFGYAECEEIRKNKRITFD